MKNKISKDDLGNGVFTLTYDGSMEVEVFIENNNVCLFNYFGRGCYRDWETDRKSTRLNSSHSAKSRMPSSA